MAKLEKAIITKKIVRPYGGVQEPSVGMTGYIIEHEDTPAKHTCIRFLANTLGYSYDPEYDDKDRKYVKIFVPNGNFEVVQPGAKKTKKELNSKESRVDSKKAEKMKQPDIMYTLGTDWKILPCHNCSNQEEMEEFIRKMDPTGCMMKVVDLDKIKNENKVAPKKAEKMKQPEIMMNIGGNWQGLPGHGCYNQKEMEEYVKELDPSGSMLKVIDLAEIKNENKVAPKKAEKMKQPEIMINIRGNWQALPGHCCYNQKEMEEYVTTLDPSGSRLKVMDLAEVKNEAKPNKKKM